MRSRFFAAHVQLVTELHQITSYRTGGNDALTTATRLTEILTLNLSVAIQQASVACCDTGRLLAPPARRLGALDERRGTYDCDISGLLLDDLRDLLHQELPDADLKSIGQTLVSAAALVAGGGNGAATGLTGRKGCCSRTMLLNRHQGLDVDRVVEGSPRDIPPGEKAVPPCARLTREARTGPDGASLSPSCCLLRLRQLGRGPGGHVTAGAAESCDVHAGRADTGARQAPQPARPA